MSCIIIDIFLFHTNSFQMSQFVPTIIQPTKMSQHYQNITYITLNRLIRRIFTTLTLCRKILFSIIEIEKIYFLVINTFEIIFKKKNSLPFFYKDILQRRSTVVRTKCGSLEFRQ